MSDITSKDIISRFNQYANSHRYILKVPGDYAFRNKNKKIIRYIRYIRENNSILVYEEGVGRYQIPFVSKDIKEDITYQTRLNYPEWAKI